MLSEHGVCFVKGTVTLDDVVFTIKIAYNSRATLDSEWHWTPLDLGTGKNVWAPKRLRGYCGEQSSAYPPVTKHRRVLATWGPSMHESSGRLTLVTAFDCILEYRKGRANGIADFSGPFFRACYRVRAVA